MSDFEEIKRATGNVENSCVCNVCKNMCKTAPCLGTPDDMLRIINNGHIAKVAPSIYMTAVFLEKLGGPIQLAAPRTNEDGSCMFHTKDGLCEIHGIKPTEGKLVAHSTTGNFRTSANYLVSQTWLNPKNESKIEKIFKAITKYDQARKR